MKTATGGLIFVAFLLGAMGGIGGAWAGNAPLGAAVAAAQQSHAKGVVVPEFVLNGVTMKQDRKQPVPDAFKDPASRKCKPFCVEPETIEGAATLQVEDFPRLAPEINKGNVLIVDMRTPDWYEQGTLPGAINVPYSDLTGSETTALATMKQLGGKEIIAFCNGWWCGQSPSGIRALVRLGYKGKIYYFRGGTQDWADAGLHFVKP